jgi:hypothetical protein
MLDEIRSVLRQVVGGAEKLRNEQPCMQGYYP